MSIRGVLRSSVVSLGAGILMGAVYWAIHVQSPAPGPIALGRTSGTVAGESVGGLARPRLTARRERRKMPVN